MHLNSRGHGAFRVADAPLDRTTTNAFRPLFLTVILLNPASFIKPPVIHLAVGSCCYLYWLPGQALILTFPLNNSLLGLLPCYLLPPPQSTFNLHLHRHLHPRWKIQPYRLPRLKSRRGAHRPARWTPP